MSQSNASAYDFTPNLHSARSISIAAQNDVFRKTFDPELGMVGMTATVDALPDKTKHFLFLQVQDYTDFKPDGNDDYCEHDFGTIKLEGETYYFKIDYYDKSYEKGSEDPANPALTNRVLLIMARQDY